jgi:transmembrane sensor
LSSFQETTAMGDQRLHKQLVQRYLDGKATKEELELFFHLLKQGKLDDLLQETNPRRRTYPLLRYAAAASLVLAVITLLTVYMTGRNVEKNQPAQVNTTPQAAPGTNKATLFLSNGQSVQLGQNDQTIQDGGADIKANNNALVYETPETQPLAVVYNTVATPKGGEYQVTLPDGTKVWLNAETSIKYPTAFNGPERSVELTGEAYFEVAKNARQPFVVRSGETAIRVLGTHFNIMAYHDETFLKTTLTEGSVAMSKNGNEVLLKPGEGGIAPIGTNKIQVAATDASQDLAWKNGQFYFNRTDLTAIMKQLARWYDLEIRYAGKVPDKRFVGKISRYTNLSDVLDVLRLSGLKFSMTGKTLIVEE